MTPSLSEAIQAPVGEHALADVIEELTGKLKAGGPVDLPAYLQAYPQHAAELRRLFPAVQLLADLSRSGGAEFPASASSATGAATAMGELGDFRILREIGRGGMGVVYEAEQISLGRRVALKVLPFAAALDSKQLQRFKNEAQAAAGLQHTNIVPVYFVGSERGVHFYAMQFVEGQTLAALIQELRQQKRSQESGIRDQKSEVRGQESELRDQKSEIRAGGVSDRSATGASALGAGLPTPPKPSTEGLPEPTGPYSPLKQSPPEQSSATSTINNQAAATETAPVTPRSSILDPPSSFFRTVANLGIQAAEALEHAHQLGVIHRDIKPANLMVENVQLSTDHSPLTTHHSLRLWIADFGLAHCQSQAGLTMSGDLVGTLRYMSPEQALAKRVLVDHRTDIYSVGVTLYELLTLEPAFAGKDREELLREIAFEEPEPPKRRNKAIPAELDTIVLKAIEKNPADRYATAQELADDLRRFLMNEPIRARRPTLVHKARKWARRHPGVTAAIGVSGVLGLLLLAIGLAVNNHLVLGEQRRTQDALKAEAERKRELRQAYDAMSSQIVDEWLAKQKELLPEHRKFLEEALANYEKFAADTGQEEDSRAGVAAAYLRVGNIRRRLGQTTEAEAAFRQAVSLHQQLAADFPAVPRYRSALAISHNDLGIFLREQGKPSEAEVAHRLALSIQEELAAEFPDEPGHREQLGTSHLNLGTDLKNLGRRTEAEAEYRSAITILELLRKEFSGVPKYSEILATTLNNFGLVMRELGKRLEAEEAHHRSVAIQEQLTTEFPRLHSYRQKLALFLHNRGVALIELGRQSEAAAAWQQAVTIETKLIREFPIVPEYRDTLGLSLHSLGLLLVELGRTPEAEAALRRALDVQEPLCKDFPDDPGNRDHLARTHNSLGVLLQRLGKGTEAETELHKGLDIREELARDFANVPDYAVNLGGSCCNFGNILRRGGRYEPALQWYTRAISTLTAVLDRDARLASAREFLSNSYMGRALTLGLLNRHTEALKDWDRAVDLSDGKERDQMRLERASTLARAKEHARATAEADAVTNEKPPDRYILYNAACVYALSAAAVGGDSPQKEQYAAAAVELLRRAVDKGWKDAEHMKKDADLEALRNRADFQKLLGDLESKGKTKSP